MSTPSPVNSYSSSVPEEIQDLLQGYGYAPRTSTPTPPETPRTTSTGPEIVQESSPPVAEALPSTQTRQGRDQLRSILMHDWETRRSSQEAREGANESERSDSTVNLHPGYPWREITVSDTDLPITSQDRPYRAAKTNPITGDPRLLTRVDCEGAVYDNGPLMALPRMDINDEIETSIIEYPFDENSYLDPQFLTLMGNKEDRGLAAKGLCLVQLDADMRSLNKWEQRLLKLEAFVHQERIDHMAKRTALQKTKDNIHRRLRAAKAGTCIA
jgi:hypothetical protein